VTFKEIQDATISKAFSEADRADVKRWINFRLAWIFDAADWTFTKASEGRHRHRELADVSRSCRRTSRS
jgi:hypothetical protein